MSVEKLGIKIRELRKQKGLSLEDVAEGVCHLSYVSKLERGVVPMPSAEILQGIAQNLDCPLQELINDFDCADFENEMLLDIIQVLVHRGEYESALELANELIHRENLLEYQKESATVTLADCHIKLGHPNQAIEILTNLQMELENKQSTDQHIFANISNLLGNAYYKNNDLLTAYSHYTRAYHISSRFPTEDLLSAKIAYNLGSICRFLRMEMQARLHLENAKNYFDKVGNRVGLANALYSLGITLKNLDQMKLAGDYIKQSLTLYEAEKIAKMAKIAKTQFAFYFLSPENALTELHAALKEYKQVGEKPLWIHTCARIAHLHLNHGEVEQAKELLEHALPFVDEVDMYNAYFLYIYSIYLADVKEYEKSLEYSFKSADFFDKIGLVKEKATSLRQAVKTYQLQGKIDDALSVSLMVNEIYDQTHDFLVFT